jgi:hypothetical protein
MNKNPVLDLEPYAELKDSKLLKLLKYEGDI